MSFPHGQRSVHPLLNRVHCLFFLAPAAMRYGLRITGPTEVAKQVIAFNYEHIAILAPA